MNERELVWHWQQGMTTAEVALEAGVEKAVVEAAIDSYMTVNAFEVRMGLDLA